MKFSVALRLSASLALANASAALPAATLIISDAGILTGASHVYVSGHYYDVSFVDGSCVSLFGGCDSNSDFAFNIADAYVAAKALRDQVFNANDIYDLEPYLTRGCSAPYECKIFIPGTIDPPFGQDPAYTATVFHEAGLDNSFVPPPDPGDGAFNYGTFRRNDDTSLLNDTTYAVFTQLPPGIGDSQTGPVPEPSVWASMLLGFGLMGFALRRREARAKGAKQNPANRS